MLTSRASIDGLLTVAIDFGTTYSGYAYGLKSDLDKDPPTISTNTWPAGTMLSSKAPTTVLFNKNKGFDSFGYEAEEKYAELSEHGAHKEWYFFRRFKMELYNAESLSTTTMLRDASGKMMLAMDVFAATVRFLKDRLLEEVHKRCAEINQTDVHWVLTVPAIWDNNAKQFMRESAEKGGIPSSQLQIALEPESASVYCQRIATQKKVHPDGSRLRIANQGAKFMVLDLGGGTADITVHQRNPDGSLSELYQASGGSFGGTNVDKEFKYLLADILGGGNRATGEGLLTTFENNHPESMFEFLRDFEIKKRSDRNDKISINIPVGFNEFVTEDMGQDIKQMVSQCKKYGSISVVGGGKLRMDAATLGQLFQPTVDSILKHLDGLFTEKPVSEIDTILMVGGFSSSKYAHDAIMRKFPTKQIYVPEQPDLSVLMGAVMYGHNPGIISSRVSRFTYGIEGCTHFDPEDHDVSKRELLPDGTAVCNHLFFSLIEAGHELKVEEEINAGEFSPAEADATDMPLEIYSSITRAPKYTSDTGCRHCGNIFVEMPDTKGGLDRTVSVSINFAGTELNVAAIDNTTMQVYDTRINFLD